MNDTNEPISATKVHRLWNGAVTVSVFGKPYDWSLRGFDKIQDVAKEHIATTLRRINDHCQQMEINRLYLPHAHAFNAKLAIPEDFLFSARIEDNRLPMFRSAYAEGMVIKWGEALWFSTADCPTIIARARDENIVIGAHAGRNSLLDVKRITNCETTREHMSIVGAIVNEFDRQNVNGPIDVFVTLGIGAKYFTHLHDDVEHGTHNRQLIAYLIDKYGKAVVPGDPSQGRIDLQELILQQFGRFKVPRQNICFDAIDTYEDERFWSHRRGHKERNGVLIVPSV